MQRLSFLSQIKLLTLNLVMILFLNINKNLICIFLLTKLRKNGGSEYSANKDVKVNPVVFLPSKQMKLQQDQERQRIAPRTQKVESYLGSHNFKNSFCFGEEAAPRNMDKITNNKNKNKESSDLNNESKHTIKRARVSFNKKSGFYL